MADLPVRLVNGAPRRIPEVWSRWLQYDPVSLVNKHAAPLRRLRRIMFDCGRSDPLLEANRLLAKVLETAAVVHTFEEYEGTHVDHIGERITTRMLPFFSETLQRQ
jgi:hypothetical protein